MRHFSPFFRQRLHVFFWWACLWLTFSSNCRTFVAANQLGSDISKLVRSLTNDSIYNKDIRPYFGEKPVVVNITMVVNDISSVSEINMDFTIDFYFRQYWRDPRLSFTPLNNDTDELTLGGDFVKLIWLPDTFIRNSKVLNMHLSTSSSQTNTLIRVKSNGDILYSTRLTSTANCPMSLQYFPGDKQTCRLILASYGYSTKDLQYHWKPGNDSFQLSELIFLPTFTIKGHRQSEYEQTLSTGTFTRIICEVFFERSFGYYMYQIYIPAFLVVVISWVPFWLDQEDNHARVGLGVTTVLTMTTLTTSTNASLPKISYIKAIDIYLFVCFLMVFLSLIEYATVGFFESKRQCKLLSPAVSESSVDSHRMAVIGVHGRRRASIHTGSIEKQLQHLHNGNNGSHGSGEMPQQQLGQRRMSKFRERVGHDSSWIDKLSRLVFPTIFILFNLIYASVFLFIIDSK